MEETGIIRNDQAIGLLLPRFEPGQKTKFQKILSPSRSSSSVQYSTNSGVGALTKFAKHSTVIR
jgi:hypothetical protein